MHVVLCTDLPVFGFVHDHIPLLLFYNEIDIHSSIIALASPLVPIQLEHEARTRTIS